MNKQIELFINLTSRVFVVGYQYVGGSVLQNGQIIERNGKQYEIIESKGLTTNNDYGYLVNPV